MAGSWQVDVNWSSALAAWFTCLASTTEPQEYAAGVLCKINSFAPDQRQKLLARAHKVPARLKGKLWRANLLNQPADAKLEDLSQRASSRRIWNKNFQD